METVWVLGGFPGMLYVIIRALIREKENRKIQNYRPDWGRWKKNYSSKNMESLLGIGSNVLSQFGSQSHASRPEWGTLPPAGLDS